MMINSNTTARKMLKALYILILPISANADIIYTTKNSSDYQTWINNYTNRAILIGPVRIEPVTAGSCSENNGTGYWYGDYPNYTVIGCSLTLESAISTAATKIHAYVQQRLVAAGYESGPPNAPTGLKYSTMIVSVDSNHAEVYEKATISNLAELKNIEDSRDGDEDDSGDDRKSCSKAPLPVAGNPINIATGQKLQSEADYHPRSQSSLKFKRYYGSSVQQALDFGFSWNGNYSQKLIFYPNQSAPTQVHLLQNNGKKVVFRASGTTWAPDSTEIESLTSSSGSTWLLRTNENTLESYDSAGKLVKIVDRHGKAMEISYASGRITAITDSFGRGLSITYNAEGAIEKMVDPDGKSINYEYGSNGGITLLTKVAYPDLSSKSYLYESSTFPTALTGIIDENAQRYATWSYDDTGRAKSSEHGSGVERTSIQFGTSSASVTDPLGSTRTLTLQNIEGLAVVTAVSQPAGSGCASTTSHVSYDTRGNVTSTDDFNGTRSCFIYDLDRKLEIIRVEGVSADTVCDTVTASDAALPANSRKVHTQWHPDWRIPVKVAQPGLFISNIYNGQHDPFSGTTASCAPASASLPDGKPIAVLCKRVEEATTDANGASGFNAVLQANVEKRQTTWTYNQFGQVLTEDGPRTDVSDITTYEYYTDTTADHTLGDLEQVTNALGRVTKYTKYNKHGQILESLDPNATLTVNTYDLRQRLLSTRVGEQQISLAYDAAGQLKRVTWPDASWIGYDYDAAHRAVAVYDNTGNRISYTLDNAGNRIGEEVKDPGGVLKRQLTRTIDALGRVQQTTAGVQ